MLTGRAGATGRAVPVRLVPVRLVPVPLVAVLGAGLLVGVLAACGRDCRDSRLQVVDVSDPAGSSVTITARLTSDGSPVSGKQINFLVDGDGQSGKEGSALGEADTGSDGRATYTVRGGFGSILLPGNKPTQIRVKFSELGGSEAYCSADARRSLT